MRPEGAAQLLSQAALGPERHVEGRESYRVLRKELPTVCIHACVHVCTCVCMCGSFLWYVTDYSLLLVFIMDPGDGLH